MSLLSSHQPCLFEPRSLTGLELLLASKTHEFPSIVLTTEITSACCYTLLFKSRSHLHVWQVSYLPYPTFLSVSCAWTYGLLPTPYLFLRLSGLPCMPPETWLHFLLNDCAASLGSCVPTIVTESTWQGPPLHGCQLHQVMKKIPGSVKQGSAREEKGTSRYSATVFLETTGPLDAPCIFATTTRSKGAKVLLSLWS